jgi:excisionase family DNA binding protein
MTHTPERLSPEPLQVTINVAAQMLGYGKSTLYELLAKGEIKSVGKGRLRRIAVAELRRWQRENEG